MRALAMGGYIRHPCYHSLQAFALAYTARVATVDAWLKRIGSLPHLGRAAPRQEHANRVRDRVREWRVKMRVNGYGRQ